MHPPRITQNLTPQNNNSAIVSRAEEKIERSEDEVEIEVKLGSAYRAPMCGLQNLTAAQFRTTATRVDSFLQLRKFGALVCQSCSWPTPIPDEDAATRGHPDSAARARLQPHARHEHPGAWTADRG
jgi:hypothetical protein